MESQSWASHVQAPLQSIDPDSLQAGLRWAPLPLTSTHGLLHMCEVAGEGKSRSEAEVPNCSHPNFPPQEEQYHQAIALLFLSRHFYFSLVPVITHVLAAALKGSPRSPVT